MADEFELELTDQVKGYLAVVGAVIFFGSNYLPLKIPAVQRAKIDPVVFQCYSAIAIFVCAWISLLVEPLGYTWWGIASASLGMPALTLALISVNLAGVAIAQAICSGIIIIVSFCWGAFVFDEDILNWGLTSLGLIFLTVGVVGVSFSNKQWTVDLPRGLYFLYSLPCFVEKDYLLSESEDSLFDGMDTTIRNEYYSYTRQFAEESKPLVKTSSSGTKEKGKKEKDQRSSSKLILGVFVAFLSGCLTGTVMVPAEFVKEEHQGLVYFFSFGTAAGIVSIAMAAVYFLYRLVRRQGLPKAQLRMGLLPGLATGILWSLGNACRVYATLYLGLTVGYPLTQLSLIVAALWGMILFQEITRTSAVFIFTFSACLVIAGAFLLGFYG